MSGQQLDVAFAYPYDVWEEVSLGELTAPSAPSLSYVAGGSLPQTTYYVAVTYVNANGETGASAEASITVPAGNLVQVASPGPNGLATGWNVYVSTLSGAGVGPAWLVPEMKQNGAPIPIAANWTMPAAGLRNGPNPPQVNSTGVFLPSILRAIHPLQLAGGAGWLTDRWSFLDPMNTLLSPVQSLPLRHVTAMIDCTPVVYSSSLAALESQIGAFSGALWDYAPSWSGWLTMGWLNQWGPQAQNELKRYASAYSYVGSTDVLFNDNGHGSPALEAAGLVALQVFMQRPEIKKLNNVLIMVGCDDPQSTNMHEVLSQPNVSIPLLISLLTQYAPTAAGIWLNLEGASPSDRSLASAWIQQLYQTMQAQVPGRKLLAYIGGKVGDYPESWSGWIDYAVWGQYVDFAAVGLYGNFDWQQASLAPRAAPTLGSTAGGSLGAETYYVKIAYCSNTQGEDNLYSPTCIGETPPSPEASLAVTASHLLTVAAPPAPGDGDAVDSYNIYIATASGAEVLQNSSPIPLGTNWTEPTSGLVTGTASPPAVNTTSMPGPACSWNWMLACLSYVSSVIPKAKIMCGTNFYGSYRKLFQLSVPPAVPSLSPTAGGSLPARTEYYKITYAAPGAESAASGETAITMGGSGLLAVVTSPPADAAGLATGYYVYAGASSGAETLQTASPIPLGTNWTEPTSGLINTGPAAPASAAPACWGPATELDTYEFMNAAYNVNATWSWDSTNQEWYFVSADGQTKGYMPTPQSFANRLTEWASLDYSMFAVWAIGQGEALMYEYAETPYALAPLLKLPQGESQKVNDREGSGSIGNMEVEVLEDPAGSLGDAMRQVQITGRKAWFRLGYSGMQMSQFYPFETFDVDRVELNQDQTGWKIQLVDLKRSFKSRIFVGAERAVPLELQGNPMDILLMVLQNYLGIGQNPEASPGLYPVGGWIEYVPGDLSTLINPNQFVDIETILNLKSGIFRNYYLDFTIVEPADAKGWIEKEIFKPLGGYPVVDSQGRLSPRFWFVPNVGGAPGVSSVFAFTDHNLIKLPVAEKAQICNSLQIYIDYDGSKFQTVILEESGPSISTFGIQGVQKIESRGLKSGRQGAMHAALLASKLFRRYDGTAFQNMGIPPADQSPNPASTSTVPIWNVEAFHSALVVEVGDFVTLTHLLALDPVTNQRGVVNILCEVLEKQPHYDRGSVSFKLLDVRYLAALRGALFTAPGFPDWSEATSAQQEEYMFIASDSTGLMTDGATPGNPIYG